MKNHTKNILIHHVSYKFLIDYMGLFEIILETNLELFGLEKYDAIYDRIVYLIGFKSSITYVFSHNHAKMKIDSNEDFTLEGTLNLHNALILIKSVLNKDQNHF